jgi:hypothetical protein
MTTPLCKIARVADIASSLSNCRKFNFSISSAQPTVIEKTELQFDIRATFQTLLAWCESLCFDRITIFPTLNIGMIHRLLKEQTAVDLVVTIDTVVLYYNLILE